jgi:hypothetical protein
MKVVLPLLLLLITMSCNNNTKNAESDTSATGKYVGANLPKGSVIAADSVLIPDPLNELYFVVKILTNDQTGDGSYDVQANYGHNEAETQIEMPDGDKLIRPVIRKSLQPFTYTIGFTYGSDTSFNDYFEISSDRGQTRMRYIKSYSFK